MEHAFGRGESLALGVEEELLLVDPETLALDHRASEILPLLGDAAKPDVYEATVETASPVSRDATEAVAALGAVRDRVREAGGTLIGCGIHPAAPFGEAPHVPGERYEAIADSMRGFMRRTPTCALHVHVGMPDAESAIRAVNGLRAYLPVLQGLAAHSPYWHGLDSGFASARAQLFRGFPRAVIPPAFAGWEDYEAYVDAWLSAGDAPDYTFLWWDIRPHPRLGTVELRAMDAQARLGSVAGLAALVHGLALALLDGRADPPLARAGDRRELVPRGPRRARGDAALGRRDAPAAGPRRRGDRPGRRGAARARRRRRARGGRADPARGQRRRPDARRARRGRDARRAGGPRRRGGSGGLRRAEAPGARTASRSPAPPPMAPTISAITFSGSQLWETPSASELLSACRTMHGSSEPVRR